MLCIYLIVETHIQYYLYSDLFEVAKKGLTEAYKMDINYHVKYGFPETISLDWNKDIIDDVALFLF